jgi:hypothetical protein
MLPHGRSLCSDDIPLFSYLRISLCYFLSQSHAFSLLGLYNPLPHYSSLSRTSPGRTSKSRPVCLLGSSLVSSSVFSSLLSSSSGGTGRRGTGLRQRGSSRRSRPHGAPGRLSCTLSWATGRWRWSSGSWRLLRGQRRRGSSRMSRLRGAPERATGQRRSVFEVKEACSRAAWELEDIDAAWRKATAA